MGLFEELSQTYPLENVHPYGLVLIVPKDAFQAEWMEQLKSERVQTYTNSWNGRVCFFLRKKLNAEAEPASEQSKPETKPWTSQDLEMLKRLRDEGLTPQQIAAKLNRSKGSVLAKMRTLKSQDAKVEAGSRSGNEALFNEFLSAAQTLYPRFKHASALLLREAARVLENYACPA